MFMDSSGHRKNILGRGWDAIGVGAYKGSDGKKMWTVLFADKCGSSAPKATAKPAPKATPKPKPKATPKPTPKPTPKATPTPTPTPAPTAPPEGFHRPTDGGNGPGGNGDGGGSPVNDPQQVQATTGTGLRIVAGDGPGGLVEAIVGDVAGVFFGT